MSARRRTTTWTITGLLSLASMAGPILFSGCGGGSTTPGAAPTTSSNAEVKSPLAAAADQLRKSDPAGLIALAQALEKQPDGVTPAVSEAQAAELLEVLNALRAGFLRLPTPRDRALAVSGAQHILDKFAVEPAPASWLAVLMPLRDVLSTGLADRDVDVRVTSLAALGKVWSWYPGRSLIGVEETTLAEWKMGLQIRAVLLRGDRDPGARAASVACLAAIPVDELAAPAVACLEDSTSGLVRNQVLVSFANRPLLLTDEMILKRLHDPETGIPQLAEIILKTRGLSKDQITLGRLITSPKSELRASVIPLLKDHDDLDPVVWLLRLSHDADELVRTKAVEAMTGRTDKEVRDRLREMASKDASPTVRAAASKLVAKLAPTAETVALPPLPGSPSLTPKAN